MTPLRHQITVALVLANAVGLGLMLGTGHPWEAALNAFIVGWNWPRLVGRAP